MSNRKRKRYFNPEMENIQNENERYLDNFVLHPLQFERAKQHKLLFLETKLQFVKENGKNLFTPDSFF
jgi:hypothetical protein